MMLPAEARCELPRITIPRTWVNRSDKRPRRLVQTTRGAAVDVSGCTGSSCFRCLRERSCGPYTTTTTIATAHHTAASNHPSLTESPPENIGKMKVPDMALFVACISMMTNTLPLALLNTQLKTTTAPMIVTMSE